jgi:hypothetical protein
MTGKRRTSKKAETSKKTRTWNYWQSSGASHRGKVPVWPVPTPPIRFTRGLAPLVNPQGAWAQTGTQTPDSSCLLWEPSSTAAISQSLGKATVRFTTCFLGWSLSTFSYN